jgi:hypothetical protein
MTLAASKFGSKCKITEDFLKKGASESHSHEHSPYTRPQSPSRVSLTMSSTLPSSSRTRCGAGRSSVRICPRGRTAP